MINERIYNTCCACGNSLLDEPDPEICEHGFSHQECECRECYDNDEDANRGAE